MESHEGGENMRLCRGDCIGLAAPSHLATREGYAPVIQAMEARGYRGARGRTRKKSVPLPLSGWGALALCALVCAAEILL